MTKKEHIIPLKKDETEKTGSTNIHTKFTHKWAINTVWVWAHSLVIISFIFSATKLGPGSGKYKQ